MPFDRLINRNRSTSSWHVDSVTNSLITAGPVTD